MSDHTRAILVVATGLLAGCAHVQLRPPEDTVEQARLALVEVMSVEDGLCAAQRVDSDWTTRALLDSGPEQSRPRLAGGSYWLEREAEGMSLEQASTQMAQSFENGKTADANAHLGVSGARQRGRWARQSFDAFADAVAGDGVRSLRRSQASVSERNLASAEYAAVWSSYFALPADDEERGVLLDWLTTRSLANEAILRSYQEAFGTALAAGCPGA